MRPRLCTCGHPWEAHEDSTAGAPCGQPGCLCCDYTPGKAIPKRKRPESDVRKAVAKELALAGFKRYVIQGRYDARYGDTGNSTGTPDEYYLHPMTGEAFFWEAKARTGRLREGQVEFARLHAVAADRANATRRNLPPSVHCWRSVASVVEWLTNYGYRCERDGRAAYPCATGAE